jgi:hypothetical protein
MPYAKIIFSQLLPRLSWRYSENNSKMEKWIRKQHIAQYYSRCNWNIHLWWVKIFISILDTDKNNICRILNVKCIIIDRILSVEFHIILNVKKVLIYVDIKNYWLLIVEQLIACIWHCYVADVCFVIHYKSTILAQFAAFEPHELVYSVTEAWNIWTLINVTFD